VFPRRDDFLVNRHLFACGWPAESTTRCSITVRVLRDHSQHQSVHLASNEAALRLCGGGMSTALANHAACHPRKPTIRPGWPGALRAVRIHNVAILYCDVFLLGFSGD